MLYEHPRPAILPIVFEFYERLGGRQLDNLILKGCRVGFSERCINTVYGLKNPSEAAGKFVIDHPSEEQLKEAVTLLCREGTEWKTSIYGKRHLMACELKEEPAVWMHFIRNRVMPTTNDTTVSQERVLLLYSMYKGLPLNMGRIIRAKIIAGSKKKLEKIFFPSLITELCR